MDCPGYRVWGRPLHSRPIARIVGGINPCLILRSLVDCSHVAPQEKVAPLAFRMEQRKKTHISICGHPTSCASLLLVVTLSMTMLDIHCLEGPAVLTFPLCALWGLLVQLCQVSTLAFPVWAASPAPWGYPVIVAQCLGSVSARLPPVP